MKTKFYKPREIARLGLITNSKNSGNVDTNYQFILELITEGKLKATDYGKGTRHYWLVSEAAIREYGRKFKKDEWE